MGKLEDNKKRKKDAIVNSAFALFIQNGINDTSIADIMKKADLAKGKFYLFFNDKYGGQGLSDSKKGGTNF